MREKKQMSLHQTREFGLSQICCCIPSRLITRKTPQKQIDATVLSEWIKSYLRIYTLVFVKWESRKVPGLGAKALMSFSFNTLSVPLSKIHGSLQPGFIKKYIVLTLCLPCGSTISQTVLTWKAFLFHQAPEPQPNATSQILQVPMNCINQLWRCQPSLFWLVGQGDKMSIRITKYVSEDFSLGMLCYLIPVTTHAFLNGVRSWHCIVFPVKVLNVTHYAITAMQL